jgi:hypothetical protein
MFKKLKRIFLSFLFFSIILQTSMFAANFVYPNEVTQGDEEITITLTLDSDMTAPSTKYEDMFEPYFVVEGLTVKDPTQSQYKNKRVLVGTFKVPRDADIGTHNVYASTSRTSGMQDKGVDVTVISKPMILGSSPVEDYQRTGAEITFHGNYFDTSGASNATVIGSGISASATPTSTQLKISSLDLTAATPGGPFGVNVVSNDGGVGISEDGSGNMTQIYTLYPKPTITDISKDSVYQSQENVQVRVLGTGFHANSNVTITGAGTPNGIEITNVVPNPANGIITVTLNVDKDAITGNRTFTVINPDGKNGTDNKDTEVISNFVTYKYKPVVKTGGNTTTYVLQGYKGEISIEGNNGVGEGFDDLATPQVTFNSDDITVNNVMYVDQHNLKVYITVKETAEVGDRTVTIKNTSYNTESTYSFYVGKAPQAKLEDIGFTTSPTSLDQGVETKIELTAGTDSEFETGAEVTAAEGITIKNTTYIDEDTLWCYVKIDEKAETGQRTIQVENPTYKVQSSEYITIEESDYNKLDITEVDPDELYQGQTSTVTVTCTGKLEEQENLAVTIGGTGLTVNNFTRMSDTELWIHLKVEKQDNLGEHTVSIENKTYGHIAVSTITVSTSSYSNPEIESSNITTLYQGDKQEIEITGKGFDSKSVFSFANQALKINSTVIESDTKAVLSVEVPVDMEEGDYALIINNSEFDATYIKQDLITINEKHIINNVSPSMLAPDTSEYFYINGTNFDIDSLFKIFIDGNQVKSTSGADTYDEIIFISSHCVSRNQIACHVYVSSDVEAGVHDVGLYFEDNGSTVTKRGVLTVPNKPVINNIPSTVSQGDNNKEVTIQGQNFEHGATVVVSGSGIIISSVSVISSNIMTFRCDVTKEAEKADREVKVINPTGEFDTGTLKVIAPPIISECSPGSIMKGTTRYLEITGQNFSEHFDLSFSGKVKDIGETHEEDAINIIEVEYTGETQISAKIYAGTEVVSGLHDIEVINYEDETKTSVQSQGVGSGLLDVRTPLNISNDVSEFMIPAGLKDKTVRIEGDGFSKDSEITISGSGIEITNNSFINSQEIEIVVDVSEDATLGKRTVTIKDRDNSAYKQIIEIIEAVDITEVEPFSIPVGLKYATMSISGVGIDIDSTTTKTNSNGTYGIDAEGQIDLLGGGVGDVVIDTDTYSSNFAKLYFTVQSTATVGSRDIRITNQDQENIIYKKGAFKIEEQVKIDLFSPSNYQITSEEEDFKIVGSGFDADNDYNVDDSTITFSEEQLSIVTINYHDDNEILGRFKWTGSTTDPVINNRNVDIQVVNKDGSLGNLEGGLYLLEQLEIIEDLVSPTTIPIKAQDFVINIKGKGIMKGATAYFWIADVGEPSGKNYNKIISKKLEVTDSENMVLYVDTTDDIVAGTKGTLVVENPNGASVEKQDLVIVDDVPAIYSFSPNKVRVGGHKDGVVIEGYNFLANGGISKIEFSNGLVITTTSVTATQIVGDIETTESSYEGYATISIETNNGKKGIGQKLFRVLEGPIIKSVVPSTLYAEKAFQIYINGSNFDDDITLRIEDLEDGTTEAVTIVEGEGGIRQTSTSLIVESVKIDEEGEYNLELTNPDGSNTTQERALVVNPAVTQAQVSSLSPQHGEPGQTNKIVEAQGSSFLDGMTIYAEGSGISVSSYTVYTASATIVLNIEANTTVGDYNLAFLNPYSTPSKKKFYVIDTPETTKIEPSNIQKGSTNYITIKGSNFVKSGGVDGGDIELKTDIDDATIVGMSFIGSTELQASVYIKEDAASGPIDLIITNPFGIYGVAKGLVNIEEELTVYNLDPKKITQGAVKEDIIINGEGFEEDVSVEFLNYSIVVDSLNYVNSKKLIATVRVSDDAQLGDVDVKVKNSLNDYYLANKVITVVPKVIVEKLNPSIVYRGNGTVDDFILEIIGSGFDESENSVEVLDDDNITISKVETKKRRKKRKSSKKAKQKKAIKVKELKSEEIEILENEPEISDNTGIAAEEDKTEVKREVKQTRHSLMLMAKERGIKNFRVLNRSELEQVLTDDVNQEEIDTVVKGAVIRWKAGWGLRKKKDEEIQENIEE